jgi:hypothetical protein
MIRIRLRSLAVGSAIVNPCVLSRSEWNVGKRNKFGQETRGKIKGTVIMLRPTYSDISLICEKQCHNSKFVIFQEKLLQDLKCYNFLWVQKWHSCSPAASFANCVMKIYLSKVRLQTFLSIPINKKCQILSCDTLVANERYDRNFGDPMYSELIVIHETSLFFSQQLLNHCVVVITCCVFWHVMYSTKP